MSRRVMVVDFNKPIRIFDLTPKQFAFMAGAVWLTFVVCCVIPHGWKIGNLPVSFLTGIFMLSFSFAAARTSELRPPTFWKRRLRPRNQVLPMYLPDLRWSRNAANDDDISMQIDGVQRQCLKIKRSAFADLNNDEQSQVMRALLDFASDSLKGMQLVCPPPWAQSAPGDRAVYLVSSTDLGINRLQSKLESFGLQCEVVQQEELRRVTYAALSPGHFNRTSVPPIIDEVTDFITLCTSGLYHGKDHLMLDGKYVRSVYLQSLPPTSWFGIADRFLDADCDLSFSVHFGPCDQIAVQERIRRDYRIATHAIGGATREVLKSKEVVRVLHGESVVLQVGLYMTMFADSVERLNLDVHKIQHIACQIGAEVVNANYQELEALIASLPIAKDPVRFNHSVSSNVAATLFPFT